MSVSEEQLPMSDALVDDAAGRCLPAGWPGASRSRFVAAAGIDWHVQIHGTSGVTLLLLHGAGASLHSWGGLIPLLTADCRLIAIDLPGHGFSTAFAQGSYSLPRTARAVSELLTVLGERPDVLVGHSAGAAIAMQMRIDEADAGREPFIVAINPAILPFAGLAGIAFPALARFAAGSRLLSRLIASRGAGSAQVRRLISGTGSRLDASGIECYRLLMQRPEHVAAVLSMMAGWRLEDLLPALRRLEPAMHFIVGGRDRAVPSTRIEQVAAQLAQTTLTRLPDCGHLAQEEAPLRVAETIRALLVPSSGVGR